MTLGARPSSGLGFVFGSVRLNEDTLGRFVLQAVKDLKLFTFQMPHEVELRVRIGLCAIQGDGCDTRRWDSQVLGLQLTDVIYRNHG